MAVVSTQSTSGNIGPTRACEHGGRRRNSRLKRLAFSLSLVLAVSAAAAAEPYPAPRFPDLPPKVTPDVLAQTAKFFVQRRPGGSLPGYNIQPGEKALILVTPINDRRIVDALAQGVREAGGTADIFVGDISDLLGTEVGNNQNWGYLENPLFLDFKTISRSQVGGGLTPQQIIQLVSVKGYDILINGAGTTEPGPTFRWEELPWYLPDEFLAAAKTGLPADVSKKLYEVAWNQLKQARRIRVTDPEGTDLSWNLPRLDAISGVPRFWREYMCQPEQLAGKETQSQEGLKQVDLNGVIAGTINHIGAFPRIKVVVKNNRIASIEGGGRFGDEWRKVLKQYKGMEWIEECAVGVVPSAVRARDAMLFPMGTISERRRSGLFHWAFGVQNSTTQRSAQFNPALAAKQDVADSVDGHFDVHTNFSTMVLETWDGKQIIFADKGHMTALDDPEVRAIAAKYGDPDTLLREAWVPPVPGINAPGNYETDYAKDPAKWIASEYDRFFARH